MVTAFFSPLLRIPANTAAAPTFESSVKGPTPQTFCVKLVVPVTINVILTAGLK